MRKATNPALGFIMGRVMRRVVVSFDDETFEQVRAKAVREKTSFAEAVRTLVEIGLEEDQCPPDTKARLSPA